MNKTMAVRLLAILVFSVAVFGQSAPPPKSVAERLGYPANARLLVIHADDFGMSHSVNRAIEEALEKHWVTSASILVPCPWFPEAARWPKAHPDADLGIHLALNSEWTTLRWGPVSAQPKGSSLLDADGYLPLTTDYVASHARISDVETETHAQVDKAKAAGVNKPRQMESAPTHETRKYVLLIGSSFYGLDFRCWPLAILLSCTTVGKSYHFGCRNAKLRAGSCLYEERVGRLREKRAGALEFARLFARQQSPPLWDRTALGKAPDELPRGSLQKCSTTLRQREVIVSL